MKSIFTLMLLAALLTGAVPNPVLCQKQKAKTSLSEKKDTTVKDTTKKVTLDDKVKSSRKIEGLFTIYQDTATGSLQLYIRKSQLNTEYLYQSFSMGGPAELFLNQNMIRETWLFKIRKNFDKISWSRSNTSFYYDKNNPVSRAANVDVSETVFYSEKLIAEDSLGYLINGDNLFLSEKLDPVKPNMPPSIPPTAYLNLGSLNKDKSEYIKVRSFPANTDVVVNLSYENPAPQNSGGADITDARYINVKMQHSFVELPQNDFVPRFDHPHVGYFTTQADNMTSTEVPIYHDYINRWHLKKKDPNAKISEPVEPIVWWVENTTPYELRQIILDAGNKWNEAFEQAGFKNAIVMKMMPDDASWDPADIRYNVIRWVSSDLGYAIGPSFVNPRTGQILGADITIDFGFMRGIASETDLYEKGFPFENKGALKYINHQCQLGKGLSLQHAFATACIEAFDDNPEEKKVLMRHFITELVLHEMGHTMGLMHNMKSSQMLSPAELKDTSITHKYGVLGSVMDYSTVNLSLDRSKQGDYYSTKVGPYDIWAIQYGYTPFKPEMENQGLASIIAKSTDPKLIFGNDADICSPGGGIDPRTMVWDLSNDPIAFATERFQIVAQAMGKLKSKFVKDNQSYENLTNKYFALLGQRFGMTRSVANYIGGIYVDRSLPGQKSPNLPYTPVPESKQREAIALLNTYVFAPNAFDSDQPLYNYLQRQRRGYNFFSNSEDPKLDNYFLGLQSAALFTILNSSTLRKINNSSMYGNTYTVDELLQDLNTSIFDADLKTNVNMHRKALQGFYTNQLLGIFESKMANFGTETKAAVFTALQQIQKKLKSAKSSDEATKNHRNYLLHLITEKLESDKD